MTELTKLQRFTVERLERRMIQGAPYNPRVILPHERQRLEKLVRKLGLLGPVTVNKLSGYTLVGGHQRLAVLDAYEKSDDYLLDVAVVELTPEQEREANVGLNNPNAQGSFDMDKLEALFKSADVKLDHDLAGFSRTDMSNMFGASFFGAFEEAAKAQATAVGQAMAEVEAMMPPKQGAEPSPHDVAKERRKAMKAEIRAQNQQGVFLAFYFNSLEDAVRVNRWLGVDDPEKRDVDGELLLAKVPA